MYGINKDSLITDLWKRLQVFHVASSGKNKIMLPETANRGIVYVTEDRDYYIPGEEIEKAVTKLSNKIVFEIENHGEIDLSNYSWKTVRKKSAKVYTFIVLQHFSNINKINLGVKW